MHALMPFGVQVNDSLKAYKQQKIASRQLYDTVLAVLSSPTRRHLLHGFLPFVAKADRTWFANCIK